MKETLNKAEPIRVAHGGRVYEAARRWGISANQVIDFSANINPLGLPPAVLAAIEPSLTPESIGAYPDPHAFVCALAGKHHIMPDEIIVGSGASALIFAVLRGLLPQRVGVLEPAFTEYSRASASVKAEVIKLQLREEDGFTPDFASLIRAIKERRFDLVILNSPHNPTGNLYPMEELLRLIESAEANNIAVMLDEAFIDYAPQASLLSLAATKQQLIVLRSLTKLYAMPALRVGYAVCGAKLAAKIREQIDPWSVSTIALEAGRAALDEDKFVSESRRANAEAHEEFAQELRRIGLHVFPSAANFLLVKLHRGSGALLESWLERERILIRRCDSFCGLGDAYIRLAVRSGSDNRRLISMIETWLKLMAR